MGSLLAFIYEFRFRIVLCLALLGITFIIIPNTTIVLMEVDHARYTIETFHIGLSLLMSVLIVYLLPTIIPPKSVFKAESIRIFCPNCGSKLVFSEDSLKCLNCNYVLGNDTINVSSYDLAVILDLALTGCGDVCLYAQNIGECGIVRKYAEKFNVALPKNCPYRYVLRRKR
ncbi:MAG: hypothetical protein QXX09_04020 [Candidatus Methanomethylicia archaeon]